VSSSTPLIPSLSLIHRVMEAEVAYTLARMQILERMPDNPIGIAYRRFDDNVVALAARHLPSPSFNKVVGLRAGQERHVQPLVDWYRDIGARGRFDLVPGDYSVGLGRELALRGYFQSGFHAALIGEPNPGAAIPGDILVEPVIGEAMMEAYLDAYVAGWSIAEEHRDGFKENVRPWLAQLGWSLYLARMDGHPVAAATLYVHGAIGYLADAATDPAFRRRGVHAALLKSRLVAAKAAGVDLVCGGAEFLSASHRNMERAGMRLLFIRSIWTPL
jgi:ribosomal protein S18 acetylase RimI-like enzyme